jgi:hypothetical protein
MQVVPYLDCIDPKNQIASPIQQEPWVVPTINDGVELLAHDPGLFSIENFLNEKEVEDLVSLMHNIGEERGMFGPCANYELGPTSSQPSINKKCFKMSPSFICEGPYQFSTCAHSSPTQDGATIAHLQEKVHASLSRDLEISPFVKFQLSTGNTPPVGLHEDIHEVLTFLIYLSDGGAPTVFPGVEVEITPKKGTAIMWTNVLEDGTPNTNAFHAVKAHAEGEGERTVAILTVERERQKAYTAALNL